MTPEEVRDMILDIQDGLELTTFQLAALVDVSWSTIKTWELMQAVTVGPPGASHTLAYAPPTAEQVELLKKLQRGEDVNLREKDDDG